MNATIAQVVSAFNAVQAENGERLFSVQEVGNECQNRFGCAALLFDTDAVSKITCPFCGSEWNWGAYGWEKIPDHRTESLIRSAALALHQGRWFILSRTPFGTGMFSPCREDVLSLIETLEV